MPALPQSLTIHTDGGARGNPGPAAAAFVVLDSSSSPISQFARFLGSTTNNQAEYHALLDALSWLVVNQPSPESDIQLKLDSLLIVNQLNKKFKVKNPDLKPLFNQTQALISHLPLITFTHIPREQNTAPDTLVNQILDLHSPTSLFG